MQHQTLAQHDGAEPSRTQLTAPRPTLRGVQFLRALAAVAVVYYHAVDAGGIFGLPSTGSWGVDVFFVISGFIIGTITVKNSSHFFRRRVFRVVPLYWIATFAWIAAMMLMPGRVHSTQVDLPGLLKSLFFIPYQMPLRDGPILQLGWTLNYEMFFYTVVAIMLLLLRRNARRALVGTIIVIGAFAASGFLFPSSSYLLSFYQNPLLLEFLVGVLLAFLYRRWLRPRGGMLGADPLAQRGSAAHTALNAIAGLLAIAALVWLVVHDVQFGPRYDEFRALAYGVPSVVLVAVALVLEPLIRDGRLTRALLAAGDGSYAIYLFHQFVLVAISQVLLGSVIASAGVPLRIALLLVTILAVILVSIGVDRWIDRPIQRLLKHALPRRG